MRLAVADHHAQLRLPSNWPKTLSPGFLATLEHPTPYLMCDLATIRDRYARVSTAMPGIDCHYALKCNDSPEVITALAEVGSGFEVASFGELELLQRHGVAPADVLYSNPVKPASHIAAAHEAGLWRFAFDSEGELHKIATHAPGAAVYVRLRVDDSTSVFPLSRKFGAEAHEARALLQLAKSLGLRPYGVTFHVGSQCTSPNAWRQAIAATGRLLTRLADDGIELEMINLSGGFPARYVESVPSLDLIGGTVMAALDELLPYIPEHLVAEPGRYLAAESAVLVASVLGREVRAGENWLYLDVGAYHGLMETQQSMNPWRFPLWSSRPDHISAAHEPFTVTGPTCDSSDTMFFGASLPTTIDVDDQLYIGSAGAYTLSYATNFNGFPPPTPRFIG
ncbi:MAG: type III PLP-dependent enzyme [Actinomycetota bacterium]|nr:type III PLP-dependent enzyme [Actinomycetota bacterium]